MINEMIFSIISFMWSGMIVGISFFEAWVKFKTPALTKEVGLEVGKTVFSYFHLMQWCLLSILTLIYLQQPARIQSIMLLSMILLLSGQTFWIFPKLCSDVNLIKSGSRAKHAYQHLFYGVIEALKIALLLAGAIYLLFKFTTHIF